MGFEEIKLVIILCITLTATFLYGMLFGSHIK